MSRRGLLSAYDVRLSDCIILKKLLAVLILVLHKCKFCHVEYFCWHLNKDIGYFELCTGFVSLGTYAKDREDGFCVTGRGADQNFGVIRLDSSNINTDELHCLEVYQDSIFSAKHNYGIHFSFFFSIVSFLL